MDYKLFNFREREKSEKESIYIYSACSLARNQMKKTEIKFRISKSTASFAFYIYVKCRKADIKEKVLSIISTVIIMNYDKEMCNRTHPKKSINLFIIYIVLKQDQKIKVFH